MSKQYFTEIKFEIKNQVKQTNTATPHSITTIPVSKEIQRVISGIYIHIKYNTFGTVNTPGEHHD